MFTLPKIWKIFQLYIQVNKITDICKTSSTCPVLLHLFGSHSKEIRNMQNKWQNACSKRPKDILVVRGRASFRNCKCPNWKYSAILLTNRNLEDLVLKRKKPKNIENYSF